jgi:DNA (cytosine-5)-methyltransferase 1
MSSARSGKGSHDDADAGSKDDRNLLVTVIAKVALELMPSLIVVENVPAFFSRKVNHPRDKAPVSAANYLITSLAKKYVAFPLITDLCDFGVPQSRSRAFLTFVRRDLPGLKDLLRTARAPFPRPTHAPDLGKAGPISLSDALTSFMLPALDAKDEQLARADGFDGFHFVPVWNQRTYDMVAAIPSGSGQSAWDNNSCPECHAVDMPPDLARCSRCRALLLRPIVKEKDGSFRLVKGFRTSYRRMHSDRPAATITTASGHIGSDYTIHPTQNRLLSPLECALLQTFPSDFSWGDALERLGHTSIRDMIGEAVPPAFTKLHGDVLYGIVKRDWKRAPCSWNDDRCFDAWTKLSFAAEKDSRTDPRTYFDYTKTFSAKPISRSPNRNTKKNMALRM